MKRSSPPVIVTPLEWRGLLKKGQVAGVARSATLTVAKDGSVSFVASAFDADRYGDTINGLGWKLDNFKANPVLLWAHSHSTPPVGRVGSIEVPGAEKAPLEAHDCTFTPAEMHAFGAEVGAMVKGGFLNAVSVGFLPIKWEERYDEGGRFLGYHFIEQELLELSVVPVPAQPQALLLSKGFAKSLSQWIETPDDSSPMARGFQQELGGFFKAADDLQASADGDGFERMEALLERIAKATEAPRFTVRLGDMEVSGPDVASVKALVRAVSGDVKALPAPAPVERTCPACGAEDGCNIDCLTCLGKAGDPVPEPAPVASEASGGEDAGDTSLASVLIGLANDQS